MSDRERLSDDECIGYARCAASYWAGILRADRPPSIIRDAGHSNTDSTAPGDRREGGGAVGLPPATPARWGVRCM